MSFQLTYSQQDSITKKIIVHNEALTVGKYYSFYLKIGDPLFGKVMSLEENKLIVYSDKNMEEIDTANITNILDPGSYLYGMHSESIKEGYNKFYLFIGAGYARTRAGASYSDDFSNGINITINALVTYTKYFGVRADFDFYHFERKDYSYSYNYTGVTQTSIYSGGTINSFLVRTNLAIGSFNPKDAVHVYILPAIGTGLTFRTKSNFTYITGTNPPVTSSSGGDNLQFSIGASFGIGFNVQITKKIRSFAEYQLNAWYLGVNGPPLFNTLKLGIILNQ
jgi:hypothetical protein